MYEVERSLVKRNVLQAFLGTLRSIFEFPIQKRQERLMKERQNYDRDQFIESFQKERTRFAILVWNALQKECVVVQGFVIKPEDNLNEVFMLAEEELDDLVLALLRKNHCRIPDDSEIESLPPLKTVSDLVEFLEYCGEKKEQASAGQT